MRATKAVLYPIFGVFQFWLAFQRGWSPFTPLFVITGIALIGLGILNLRRLSAVLNTPASRKDE